jgi:hypothetical protein
MEGSTMQKEIITPEILAGKLGRGTDAIRKRWNGIWPGRKFSASAELTESEVLQLSASGSAGNSVSVTKRKSAEKKNIEIPQETRAETRTETMPENPAENEKQKLHFSQTQVVHKVAPPASVRSLIGLYFLLSASTAASVYNLLLVTLELSDRFSAFTLTVVLSAAAVVFVSVGIKSPLTGFVVAFLIAYEALCNTVRIYGGLTHWGEGTPNVFLRTVTDVFSTGTYATATLIGAVTAALIAGVQYASVFEINRLKNGKV